MMFETRQRPICEVCEDPINVWDSHSITDAYQKGGSNHYQFACPECDLTQSFSIPIEDDNEPKPQSYSELCKTFLRVMVFGG